jgi:hypothetical protein
MSKTDIPVKDLVGMIERGELRLPEMQRRYVWRASRVRDLLDSLYRGYPSGSILVWETDKEQPTRDLSVSQQTNPFTGHKLLLDGQQRLTSLSAVLRGEPIKVRGRKRDIDILFNLEHPDKLTEFTEVVSDEESALEIEDEADEREQVEEEEISLPERLKRMTFVVASKALAQQPNWVSVTKVFKATDAEVLKAAGVKTFDDPRYEKYSLRLKKLRSIADYLYAMHVLQRDLSYEEVAEIFVRVNSLGAKLRGSDLALAQITARWQNSLKLLEEFQDECEERWMTLDLGLLVRAMVVFATGQCRFDRVSVLPVSKLKQGWEDAKEGLRFAINFLRTNADIEDESLLSSPMFFITVAYFSYKRKQKLSLADEKSLLYWLYVANARGRYSRGSSETILDEDLAVLKKDGGPEELVATLRKQIGRLDFEPGDFAGRGAGNALFALVFLALKAKGATDWRTGLGLSLTHQGRYHYIQYHHIFPKALLKTKYEKQEINEIANMAFVSGRMNREIGATEPATYLPNVVASRGEQALTMQGVPLDAELHRLDNYRAFLEARRTILTTLVTEFLQNARSLK